MYSLKFDTSNCKLKSDKVAVSLASISAAPNYGVSLYIDKKGKKWVRINVYKYDFLLAIEDFVDESKTEFTYQEALNATKKYGWTTPSKEEWDLVDAYRDEVDAIVKEAGGKVLGARWYWSRTVAQSYSNGAWLYYGNGGKLYYTGKYHTFSVRALAYPD